MAVLDHVTSLSVPCESQHLPEATDFIVMVINGDGQGDGEPTGRGSSSKTLPQASNFIVLVLNGDGDGDGEHAGRGSGSKTLSEILAPAALLVAILSSIPQAFQLDNRDVPLYKPLLAFTAIGSAISMLLFICALFKRTRNEAAEKSSLAVAMGLGLVALILRLLLTRT